MKYELINKENFLEIRKELNQVDKTKNTIVVGKTDELNRKILEDGRANFLLFDKFSESNKKLKQRESGLNHILCKIAKKNNISFIFDFKLLLEKEDKKLSSNISAISQNIKLLKKQDIMFLFIGIKNIDRTALKSFLLTLGADTQTAKYCSENSIIENCID